MTASLILLRTQPVRRPPTPAIPMAMVRRTSSISTVMATASPMSWNPMVLMPIRMAKLMEPSMPMVFPLPPAQVTTRPIRITTVKKIPMTSIATAMVFLTASRKVQMAIARSIRIATARPITATSTAMVMASPTALSVVRTATHRWIRMGMAPPITATSTVMAMVSTIALNVAPMETILAIPTGMVRPITATLTVMAMVSRTV